MCALKPPFHAADMQGLFRRVCEGSVPNLPNNFSKDLNYMIKLMLQQNPKLRPTCSEILSKPQLVKNVPNKMSVELEQNGGDALIGTIKVPVNLNQISDRLPHANYERKIMSRQVSLPAIAPTAPSSTRAADEPSHKMLLPPTI